jgi:deoxyhypusine synthase
VSEVVPSGCREAEDNVIRMECFHVVTNSPLELTQAFFRIAREYYEVVTEADWALKGSARLEDVEVSVEEYGALHSSSLSSL